MSLEKVYIDNHKYLKYYFEQLHLQLISRTNKHVLNQEIAGKLKQYNRKVGEVARLNRLKNPQSIALAMYSGVFEIMKEDGGIPPFLQQRGLQNFTFKLIEIITPYL